MVFDLSENRTRPLRHVLCSGLFFLSTTSSKGTAGTAIDMGTSIIRSLWITVGQWYRCS